MEKQYDIYKVCYHNANSEDFIEKIFNVENSKKQAESFFKEIILNDEELKPIITENKTDSNMNNFDEIMTNGYLSFMENGNNIELEIVRL